MKLLAAIRARAAERGLTLADLARAARMQPGNLRRMLANSAASPRLGSAMRLLPPLQCRIAPAGARIAAELVAHLDGQRRARGLEWEQLLGQPGKRTARFAALALSDADGLSLADVARVADALHVELSLVDDLDQSAGDGAVTRTGTSRRRATRNARSERQVRPQGTVPPPVSPPDRPQLVTLPSASPPTPGRTGGTTPSLGPLRPPRLGRYGDAGAEQRVIRPPTTSWTPREPRPELTGALLPHLAELSGDQWGDVYTVAWGALSRGASLPQQFVDHLGRMTESFLARLRRPKTAPRPTVPDPPDGWYDLLDPALLVQPWLASRQPGYRSTDTIHHYDEHGIRIGHLALDSETMAAVRLAPHGSPHSLIDLVHLPREGEAKSLLSKAVPLAVKLGGERHPFRHVKAGPVFGEIAADDRVYLLAAVSSLLVILEVANERARVVWGGRAERLPGVVIEPTSPGAATRAGDPATTVAELERRLADAEARLAAERQAREEDRRGYETRAQGAQQTPEHFESTLRYITELQAQLSAQTQEHFEAESKRLLAEARLKKVVQAHDILEAELAELRSGAATQIEDPAAIVTDLERRLKEADALLTAERRAREEDRRTYATGGQEAGQTSQYAENSLRYIDELQARLRAKTEEQLEAEDKRLIAEDKRLIAEEQLKRVAQARDELDALRSSPTSPPSLSEQPTVNSALIDAEHRARHAADEVVRLARELAVSQAQEQATRDALAATHQELAGVRQAQADEMSQIRELLAAKRFLEAVVHSLARSLGADDVEAVLAHLPPFDTGVTPLPETSPDDGPVHTTPPAMIDPQVAAHPFHGRRNVVNVAHPADYPAYQATPPVRKPGRNEACPCGSGKKYKKCCGMVAT